MITLVRKGVAGGDRGIDWGRTDGIKAAMM